MGVKKVSQAKFAKIDLSLSPLFEYEKKNWFSLILRYSTDLSNRLIEI